MMQYMLMCILCGMFLVTVYDVAAAEEHHTLQIKDNIVKKSGHVNTIQMEGKITIGHNANMTLISPDGAINESVLTVTKNGDVNDFVFLDETSQSGLYTVNIRSYNSTIIHETELHFFLADYDGMVDVTVQRNAAISCLDDDDNVIISDECISPADITIPKTFGLRFFNSDYKNHQFDVGGLLTDVMLPDGDSIVYLEKTGSFDYFCTIHPWLGGAVTVTDVPSMRFSIASITEDLFEIPADTVLNQTQLSYDDSCSMCYVGQVTKIVDGDTIHIDNKPVRLSLVNTPEKRDDGFEQANQHVRKTCPVGTLALVNIDDFTPQDNFGNAMAQITCGDVNLNASLLYTNNAKFLNFFCDGSEFANEQWTSCTKNISEPITEKINDVLQINNTSPQNVTESTVVSSVIENSNHIIFIFFGIVLVLIVICLKFFSNKSAIHTKSKDSIVWEYLE